MRIAFPTNNEKTIANHIGLAKKFLVVDTTTGEKFTITNPVIEEITEKHINLKELPEGQRGLGVGRIVPVLLKEAGVDALVAPEFGEGMYWNLQRIGITPIETQIKNIDEFLETLDEKEITLTKPETDFGYRRFGFGRGFGYSRGFGRGFGYGRGYGYGRGFGRCGYGFGRGFRRGF